ncbi:MAG: hypothetical protein PUG12_08525 [Prevotella sp.]|nr:hypothetical protein [Prevotella sp.]
MKKLLAYFLLGLMAVSCQESLEDRAARELKEYTEKNCPTPVVNDQQMDSASFERESRTLRFYYKLYDKSDSKALFAQHGKDIRKQILNELKNSTSTKSYKDASFNYRYTYRSASNPNTILLDVKFTSKDYK